VAIDNQLMEYLGDIMGIFLGIAIKMENPESGL